MIAAWGLFISPLRSCFSWYGLLQPPALLRYTENMAVKAIQQGQVWREESTGESFLVTKLYSEVFSQFAILRPADASAPDAETRRIKVSKTEQGMTLPGYVFTQDSNQEF